MTTSTTAPQPVTAPSEFWMGLSVLVHLGRSLDETESVRVALFSEYGVDSLAGLSDVVADGRVREVSVDVVTAVCDLLNVPYEVIASGDTDRVNVFYKAYLARLHAKRLDAEVAEVSARRDTAYRTSYDLNATLRRGDLRLLLDSEENTDAR